jgi:hypothetical protein
MSKMGGRKPAAGNYITKERVSSKSIKHTDNINLVPTSVAAKGQHMERSGRSSNMPSSGGEAAAENRCAGHKD